MKAFSYVEHGCGLKEMRKTKAIAKPYEACFDTLANGLRIEVLRELGKGETSVLRLADALGVEQSRLSHALKALRECRYVDFRVEGKERVYFLVPKAIEGFEVGRESLPMFAFIDAHIENHCGQECRKLKCVIAPAAVRT